MADGIFNIAKGKVNAYTERVATNDPANCALVVVLLSAVEADSVLQDYDTLADILAAAGNTEATFTNYARKILTDAEISAPVPDDATDSQSSDAPDQTWSAAGGTTDNSLVKALICYDPDTTAGDDSNIIPLTFQDFAITTNGNDLTAIIDSNGFYTA